MGSILKDTIESRIKETIDLSSLNDKKLLLCVSGGIDSIFLYHNILALKTKYNFKIGLAHVNYNTSKISYKAMNLCKELSTSNCHPLYLKVYNKTIKSNFEHAAREVRYNFFNQIKEVEGYDYILTAHNKDDFLETLYMQREIDDFSILPYSNSPNYMLRPLLDIKREEIEEYITNKNYLYMDDPTNLDTRYKRNHIRINVFPKMKNKTELSKSLFKDYLLKLKKYKKTCLEMIISKNKYISYDPLSDTIKIDNSYIRKIDYYSFKLIFQGIINKQFKIKINNTNKFWQEMYRQILLPNKKISFNIHKRLAICSDFKFLYIHFLSHDYQSKRITNKLKWGGGKFTISKNEKIIPQDLDDKNVFIATSEDYKKGLFVRKWFNGDKILTSNNQTKLISDLFNNYKLLPFVKSTKPIITREDNIAWIPGVIISGNNHLINKSTIRIEWHENRG